MSSTALATRPVVSLVAEAVGAGLPRYVLPDQARRIINAAETTTHRLLLETLWQSGGRLTEVLRLRPCDLDLIEGALRLANLKQRSRANRTKLVYVDAQLVGDLRRLATDAHVPMTGYLFGARRHVERFVYFDDLDPHCLDTGIVVFDGAGFGPLWALCRKTGLRVVADVHTHGGRGPAHQSPLDRNNPMVAQPGHLALIVPNLAQPRVAPADLGIYEYLGQHRWRDHSGPRAGRFFYLGMWG